MKSPQRTTIVGVFEDRNAADQAVDELRRAGFREDQIGVVMRHDEGIAASGADVGEGSHAGSGAIAGAISGLGLGALAGLGVLSGVIPVIGPAIAAGTLGVVLSNAAAGAGIAGLVGALVGAGIPEEEAQYYEREFEAGRTVVTVNAEARGDEATALLRRHGAYDMSSRSAATGETSEFGQTGGMASSAAPLSTTEGETIQVKEERLRAEKRPVEAGEVRVRKDVRTETKTIEVPVQREEVVIERTPVQDRPAPEGISTGSLRPGEEIRVPVREEEVDVSKQAVVTEEVKVGKQAVPGTEKVTGQVRKEEVKIDPKGDVDVRTTGKGTRMKE